MPNLLMTFLSALAFIAGIWLVAITLLSVIRTFVLPRSARDPVSRFVFSGMRKLFNLRLKAVSAFSIRDDIMALYAPISLMMLLATWYICVMLGYAMIYWGTGIGSWTLALRESGSSLLTLGFEAPKTLLHALIAFSEAMLGLILVALLIAYLPTMYSAFSRRESAVTLLEVRAGEPPSAVEMLKRYHRIHGLERLGEVWENWEMWFADVEESHTSLAALVFFRSPRSNQSWVTASGTVLDAAALTLAAIDIPPDARANLCIRAGYLALRHIADYFEVQYNPDPSPNMPISVPYSEFNLALDELARQGLPVKSDREQAWRDFAGWRVNYDHTLITMAKITMAPKAFWISDGD